MDELDFTIPPGKLAQPQPVQPQPAQANYNPAALLDFFESAGIKENVSAGKVIFSENEKGNALLLQRNKMYLLLAGEVEVSVKGKPVSSIQNGEIFGEMAAISNKPRSATATAKTACSLIAVDDKQLRAELRKKPEFVLILMSIMAGRLRNILARLDDGGTAPVSDEDNKSRVFDKKMLAYLADEVGDSARMRYVQDRVIMQEGQTGALMYVVLEGLVTISMRNSVIEKVGPGGMFGEMALIESTKRLASAVAETDSYLLAINRNTFLDLVRENPEFGIALLGAVGERVRGMASRQAP